MCDSSGFVAESGGFGGLGGKIAMASSLVSAIGNIAEGRQAKSFYNYRADQAIADAAYERGMAAVRAGKIRKAGALKQAEVRAGYAGSGIDVNTGTPLVTAERLQRDISEDALAELYTGERRGRVLEAEAQGYRAAGSRAVSGSYLSAGRSMLTGAAAAMDSQTKADKWIRKQALDFQARKRAEFALGGGFEDGEF